MCGVVQVDRTVRPVATREASLGPAASVLARYSRSNLGSTPSAAALSVIYNPRSRNPCHHPNQQQVLRMGQAKLRGPREMRIAAAVASVDRLRPEFAVCGKCQTKVTELEAMDTRNLDGIAAAFSGICSCCHRGVFVFAGEKDAVDNAMLLMQRAIDDEYGLLPASLDTIVEELNRRD